MTEILIKAVNLINSPLETPLRNLGTTPLLYSEFRQTYLNTSASNRTHKKAKKKIRNELID